MILSHPLKAIIGIQIYQYQQKIMDMITKMDQLVNVRIIRFIVKETESPTYFILILEIIVVLCFFNAMGLGIT